MRLPDEPELPLQINIVPMIDVIFALLTFFIMSTLYLTRSEGLSVDLPTATTGQTQPPAEVTVTIDKQGRLAINRKPIQLEALNSALQKRQLPKQELFVVVDADRAVSHGRVIEVMDIVRQIQGARLAIATQKPD